MNATVQTRTPPPASSTPSSCTSSTAGHAGWPTWATIEFLERHHIAFASATGPIDTTTSMGKLFLQILGSFAEYEREVIVERIFTAYTRDRLGLKTIAQELNADGLPTPGSRPWSADAVSGVLRNRTSIGELPFRDDWGDGAHGPLLDPEVFVAAAEVAASRSTPAGARRATGDFVLSGIIVCGHCDDAYIGNTGLSRNKTKVRYYSCVTARRYGKTSCAGPTLPADYLERQVADAVVATYADTDVFTVAVEADPGRDGPGAHRGRPGTGCTPCSPKRIHSAGAPVRKAMFTALVARLEVHARDDVRPTFRARRARYVARP